MILETILEHVEAAEREVAAARARKDAFTTLERVARLMHRTEASFAALTACQPSADQTRAALKATTTVDAHATAPFAALLRLVDRSPLDDSKASAYRTSVIGAGSVAAHSRQIPIA